MTPILFAVMLFTQTDQAPVYKNPQAPLEQRVEDALSRMTLEEKVLLTHGKDDFAIAPIPRLGIPSLTMSDGPLGARWGRSTAFPASICSASSWDLDLMRRVGVALGQEFKHRGRAVALGPCVGLVRVPHGGRNFESFGEDPYLNGEMAAAYIQGEQSQKVASCVKHYALNNQEYQRGDIDIQTDERTMREGDLRVFEAAVKKGGAMSIMAAYNLVNGKHCSESAFLLDQVLKKDWGFQGFAVSDWGAVHSTAPCANAGLDVEMPGGDWGWWAKDKLLKAVKNGEVPEKTIDEMARRVLRVIFWSGLFDEARPQHVDEMVEHRKIALEAAQNGMVLLKNKGGVLPIAAGNVKTIAVIGPYADVSFSGGGGSSHVDPFYSVTALRGLQNRLGNKVKLVHVAALTPSGLSGNLVAKGVLLTAPNGSAGLQGEYFPNVSLAGKPLATRVDKKVDFDWGIGRPAQGLPHSRYSVRWTGDLKVSRTGTYNVGMISDDGSRVFLDGKLIVDDWHDHAAESHTVELQLTAGQSHSLKIEYYNADAIGVARFVCSDNSSPNTEAIEAAAGADAAIVCVGMNENFEGEGWDRPNFALMGGQERLIKDVAKANPNTTVVLIGGSQFLMSDWIDDVPAVVVGWYGGEEGGNALADVLLGNVNPSGKLPMSFVKRWQDHWAHTNYPGNKYTEGIFLGYRYMDQNKIEPQFPFGFGLSYTTFSYSKMGIGNDRNGEYWVRFRVTNTGKRFGKEVAQVYVGQVNPTVPRPRKELKGFVKVPLEPGQSKDVDVRLGPDAFTYFDVARKEWFAPAGEYTIMVGASSRDIRLKQTLKLSHDIEQLVTRKL